MCMCLYRDTLKRTSKGPSANLHADLVSALWLQNAFLLNKCDTQPRNKRGNALRQHRSDSIFIKQKGYCSQFLPVTIGSCGVSSFKTKTERCGQRN